MAKKKPQLAPSTSAAPVGDLCAGSRVAFNRRKQTQGVSDEPHRPGKRWGNCWSCGQTLGCTICTTSNALEVLCRRCGAWGTLEAFEHHGTIVPHPNGRIPSRPFEAYPPQWRSFVASAGNLVLQLALGPIIEAADVKDVPR